MVALVKMPERMTARLTDFGAAPSHALTTPKTGAERRIFPRKDVQAEVVGNRVDHSVKARQNPRVKLTLRDLSLGGMSAISDTPVDKGEQLSVYFPPLGLQAGTIGGWDAFGRVLRCEQSGTGYRIAVEFDPLPAA